MKRVSLVLVMLTACADEPALVRQARMSELVGSLSRAFLKSVEAEKSAVLAITDDESERFAAESRAAARQVDALVTELRALIDRDGRPGEREKLSVFSATWAKVAAIDARLLPLAVANTNLKAAHRSTHEATRALERLLGALTELEARARDPVVIRRLAAAAVAALTIQTLHAPHIASPDEAEMRELEARIQTLEGKVDEALKAEAPGPKREEALLAWHEYQAETTEILRLSRLNTNVLSFSLSVHEKRDATVTAEVALQALVIEVQTSGPRPTR